MSVGLRVTEYNLALVPNVNSGTGTLNLQTNELETGLASAYVTDEGARIVSPADQISIVMSPPTLAIVDHAGVPPVRDLVRRPVATIERILGSQGFSIAAFGWNIAGSIDDVAPSAVMRKLIRDQEIDAVFSPEVDRDWFVPLIQFNAESDLADRIALALQTVPGEEAPELSFIANVHFERQLPLDEVVKSGDTAWAEVESLLARLVK